MLSLQISLDPTRTYTDEHGTLRPLTDLHRQALAAMRQVAKAKQFALSSYATGDRLPLSEALVLLRELTRPLFDSKHVSTRAREAFGLLCIHGKVFTDGTTVWLLGVPQ